MAYFIKEQTDAPGPSWSFGSGGVNGRYGGAHRDGKASLHSWGPANEMLCRTVKCSTYRKAQRKLRQWLKGYNV